MALGIVRLDHVQLSIPEGSEGKARTFYIEVVGCREVEKPGELKENGGLWFEIGDIGLHLGIEENRGKVKRHPAFEVSDIREARRQLESRGVEIREEIAIPGVERFSFYDPFGNRIELLERR